MKVKNFSIIFKGKFGRMEILVVGVNSKNYLVRELEDKGYKVHVRELC